MKKIFLTGAVALFTGLFFFADAGTVKTDKAGRKQIRKERREERRERWLHSVSAMVRDQFHFDFPDATNVRWNRNAFEEATFTDGTVVKTAYYDSNDDLVGTATDVDYSTLPENAKQYIGKKYPGYTAENVILFDDNEANDTDMILFNSSFEDKDTYFPVLSNGTKEIVLKVTTDGRVTYFGDHK